MKAYEIILKRCDIFCFYLREDEYITLVTDENYPYPCTYSEWVKETNTFEKRRIISPDKVLCPTYAIRKEDYNEFLQIHIPQIIRQHFDLQNETMGEKVSLNNIIVLKKEWDEVYEIGMCIRWEISYR